MRRIGVIVNPLAGIGGRVGLKGSDGIEIQRRARELGAIPQARQRATVSLLSLTKLGRPLEVFTYPLEMGETAAREAGLAPRVVGQIRSDETTADDTRRAAREMSGLGVDLLLFAGGDGTARDICVAVPAHFPCLGIPAGVKIHSAAFATSPGHAGELAGLYLEGKARLREAEVLDLDEDGYRAGNLTTRLYGTLHVPYRPLLRQNQKTPSPAAEIHQLEAIAVDVCERLRPGVAHILGPGTTTRAIARALNLEKTLIGVDVVRDGTILIRDAGHSQLLDLLDRMPASIIVAPIGGQGFLFGRGNQQIAPDVIHRVGRENITVVSTPEKLRALGTRPFIVDTGDPAVDALLVGYFIVVTGYRERTVYKVVS